MNGDFPKKNIRCCEWYAIRRYFFVVKFFSHGKVIIKWLVTLFIILLLFFWFFNENGFDKKKLPNTLCAIIGAIIIETTKKKENLFKMVWMWMWFHGVFVNRCKIALITEWCLCVCEFEMCAFVYSLFQVCKRICVSAWARVCIYGVCVCVYIFNSILWLSY